MKYKHLFGPVSSRRLGVSLGIDLVPYKHCPLNCVYCEIQSTTYLQTQREEFFPVEEILEELDSFLASSPELDYITFSGAGEPTLYSRIGEVVDHIKAHYPQYKLALLTNGILLSNEEVLNSIIKCDLILPSLDAATQEVFERVNRPMEGVMVAEQIEGLVRLRQRYSGEIHLEVFIVPDITDTPEELEKLRDAILRIKPDLVQLNSLDRPGTEEWVEAADAKRLIEIQKYMQEKIEAPIEVIAKIEYQGGLNALDSDLVERIRGIILRRPCTAEELAKTSGAHINEISKALRELNNLGKLKTERKERGVFYSWIE
ncbi:MAG: radical SAM protein [Candidatus Cloacimonetes bacterium]|jgi:wyosine [tRNA(Phe)-imidazoG37] synthetase (radical SAM superfamily)|nr:radical SAM protein [Candidatus Cloacimonadota bacterium]NLO44412.1 radical SAM protein [Candidatus Cloacimonadota bacterium]